MLPTVTLNLPSCAVGETGGVGGHGPVGHTENVVVFGGAGAWRASRSAVGWEVEAGHLGIGVAGGGAREVRVHHDEGIRAHIPEILPTHVRGVDAGFINGSARAGGVLRGLVIARIFAVIGFQGLYLGLAAIMVLVGVLGERTAKRALEEISGE